MNDRQLIEDLLSALEYHTEQTRPIEFSKVAIEAAREHLRKTPQHQQEPITDERRMIEMVDAAMLATASIYSPITRSQCKAIIEAAHGITKGNT